MLTHVIELKYVELPIVPTEYNGFLRILAGDPAADILNEPPVTPRLPEQDALDYATLNFVYDGNHTAVLYPGDLILIHDNSRFSVVLNPDTDYLRSLLLTVGVKS